MSGEASNQERLSGVLLHVTSLPSYGGVGDFGPAAYSFVDFLASAKQRLWQVLPLSPTGYGSSPYSALSAFAGNPLLISLELLVREGWIAEGRIAGLPGHDGPADFARRQDDAMTKVMNDHGRELAIEQVIQFFFNEQWCALRSYCAERKIRVLGDVAIFVNMDSADVWTHPELLELDKELKPVRVSGVPPDYFSPTGQRWGNPLYKWGLMKERGFD